MGQLLLLSANLSSMSTTPDELAGGATGTEVMVADSDGDELVELALGGVAPGVACAEAFGKKLLADALLEPDPDIATSWSSSRPLTTSTSVAELIPTCTG